MEYQIEKLCISKISNNDLDFNWIFRGSGGVAIVLIVVFLSCFDWQVSKQLLENWKEFSRKYAYGRKIVDENPTTIHQYHRRKICIDCAWGVRNSTSSEYEFLFVFWSFLCISLDVLVSFSQSYRNFYLDEKSSLTHSNL
jgi:hypothetical protein